jgi:AAA ATPase domain
MNATPRSPTSISTAAYPREFQQVIREKSANFVGREFVFAAINDFFDRENRGYFTLVGSPGSGKSAILAKYVAENPDIVYYNAQITGKNQVDEFLTTLCNQLIDRYHPLTPNPSPTRGEGSILPDNVTDGSWFLSLLLQKISDRLESNQRLIIAIDGLDAIDRNSQSPGVNLFYLPRYLPNNVDFILARRPFFREKSGLLIETPSRIFDLQDYPAENRIDVQKYIQQNLKITEPELQENITDLSENNFMYLKGVGDAIAQTNSYQLPETLETYYQQHWQKMKGEELSAVELGVLQTLIALPSRENNGISAQLIAETIDEDEYEIEEVLENWYELLVKKEIDGEVCYSIYHSSFRDWLGQQINLG